MSLNSAPDRMEDQENVIEDRKQQVGTILEEAVSSGSCIDCGNLLSMNMPAKYATETVIGSNGGLSLFMHKGQFYMTGSPSVVKKLKESGYAESSSLGVPTEQIANALPYVKNFLKSNVEKFTKEQETELKSLDDKYTV